MTPGPDAREEGRMSGSYFTGGVLIAIAKGGALGAIVGMILGLFGWWWAR